MTELPSGTVTFLFTDLEDSTRLWDEHPDAMRKALSRHDAILVDAIERNHGTLVKSTGDGAYAVFATATDAVVAAVAIVRRLIAEPWEATGPLRARLGIHTGAAESRDGDYFGASLNRASRLMALAHGGQAVVSQTCASIVREQLPDGVALRDLGEHRLRGLQRSERVFQVVIADVPAEFPPLQSLEAFPGALELPLPSVKRRHATLAGRADELERLLRAWDMAVAGTRQVVLVSGEPGIGKTRLLEEVARRAHAQGGLVLYGRCDEELVIPHQPFIEALRPCVSVYPVSALRQRLHGLEPDLARAFPELLGRLPDVAIPDVVDPEAGRYRFFEAITTLVTGITAAQPTLLVLDDLHWADKSTLLLLRHLVRATASADLMIVAVYRDRELQPGDALADLLAGLHREVDLIRVLLAGIVERDSDALIAELAGHEVAPGLASALHRESGGNPFFLEELVRHLIETGRLAELEGRASRAVIVGALDLPEGVREVVNRRLRRLPDPVREILTVAAVVGREFDAELLARASDQPAARVLDLLGHAADAGLITPNPRLGRYTFEHALIRQTLDTTLGPARAVGIHAAVGTALEAAGDSSQSSAALAHHFMQSVPLTGAAKAIHYASRAGHQALADVAVDDAVTCFANALRIYEEYGPPDPAVHVELLIDLAGALIQVDEQAGVDAARRAVDAARADGSPEQFGRAVAAFVEPMYGVHAFPTLVTDLLDEARGVLGEDHPALRARLLAFEAFKYAAFQLRGRDGRVLAADAVATARVADDPVTLSDALFALAVSLEGTDDVSQRLSIGEELLAMGEVAGARASAFGFRVLAGVQLELGDPDALESTIIQLARVGTEQRWLPASVYATQWAATQALLEGRFDDVHVRGTELRRYVRAYRGAGSMHLMQTFSLARDLGTLTPIGPSVADDDQSLLTWAMLSLAQLESGDEAQAFENLDRLAEAGLDRRGPESRSGAALATLVEVAARRGTPAHAAELYELLEPFRGRLLALILGLACVGAADRYLGMLSAMLERWDDATGHFDRALELETSMRGHALVPRTEYWKAWSLRARGRTADAAETRVLLDRVVDATGHLGMAHLRRQAESLRDG